MKHVVTTNPCPSPTKAFAVSFFSTISLSFVDFIFLPNDFLSFVMDAADLIDDLKQAGK